jgi:hypothetical protein
MTLRSGEAPLEEPSSRFQDYEIRPILAPDASKDEEARAAAHLATGGYQNDHPGEEIVSVRVTSVREGTFLVRVYVAEETP